MKHLYFLLPYDTQWGEHLELYYSVDGRPPLTLALTTDDGRWWQGHVEAADDAQHVRHTYLVADEAGRVVRTEPNAWRYFEFGHRGEVTFADVWAEASLQPYYCHTAFSECAMRPRGGDALHLEMLSSPYLLLLHALPAPEGKRWGIVGSTPALGEWHRENVRPLQRTGTYEWGISLPRAAFEEGARYKYVLYDVLDPTDVQWEEGDDRELFSAPGSALSIVRQDEMPRITAEPWRGAGCVVPVFSLRTQGSFGIGDFGDLLTFIRWASELGMKAVQLLPINDTTRTESWADSYPYNGTSVFALHPIYLDPREWKDTGAYLKYKDRGAEVNALAEIDYEAVYRLKKAFLRDLYAEIGGAVCRTASYRAFVDDNGEWLLPYARFSVLRQRYGTADFRHWPADGQACSDNELRPHCFVQYLLDRQMMRCHDEASERGVILKGDIPIGISRDSVPAREDGRLFHFDGQAGAPPDYFARHGQNWGFPTYNWEEMEKDGYAWWRRRLGHMSRYFHAYRIDHVLGFFRIWEIPTQHIYGLLGHFRPALPFSTDELRAFGFTADPAPLARPYLSAERLAALSAEADLSPYVRPTDDGGYTLRDEYLAQNEAARLIADERARRLVLDVIADVLFVPDPDRPGLYHPRIMGHESTRFLSLSESDREAFRRLHGHFFYERHNDFWGEEAMKRLPTVTRSVDTAVPAARLRPVAYTSMLPCAEDLGFLPTSVKGVLERLQILSLEIQRMPKENWVRFSDVSRNPYLSVATIDTHDMPPLRLWWREDREQTAAFWHEALGHEGEPPAEAVPQVVEEVVVRHLDSPSMLCLISLQDWLALSARLSDFPPEKEQINVPANADNYWRYRMHIPIETLIADTDYNERLRSLLALHYRA